MLESFNTRDLIQSEPEPIRWAVDNIAARGAVTLLYGDKGIGKSLLALALAGAMTGETNVGNFRTARAGALLVDGENGTNELSRRLHYLNFNGQCGNYFEAYKLTPGSTIDSVEGLTSLMYHIGAKTPGLVLLDSMRRLWWGNENDSIEVSKLCMNLQQIAQDYDTAIIMLHHPNKGGEFRGSGAWGEVPEIVVRVGRHRRDMDHTRRYLIWDKCRLAEEPDRKWFRIQPTSSGVEIEAASRPTEGELWSE